MEKPINVIESGEYVEPNTFESDTEAILFYAYIELLDYVNFLENEKNRVE